MQAKNQLFMPLMCKRSGRYCSRKEFCNTLKDACDDVRDETKWTTCVKYYFYSVHFDLTVVISYETLSEEIELKELFGRSLNIC